MRTHKERVRARLIIVSAALFSATGMGLAAQEKPYDWGAIRKSADAYCVEPSRPTALRFIHSLPQAPVPGWMKGPSYYELIEALYPNLLDILDQQLRIDPTAAAGVAFALYDLADGRLEHWLDLLLGDHLEKVPRALLRRLESRPQSLELSTCYGFLLCEGRMIEKLPVDEVCQALERRAQALEAVKDEDLSSVRNRCVEAIRRELARLIEFTRSHTDRILSKEVMDEFLRSPYPEARKRAYDHIIGHKDEFVPVLRDALESWRDRLRSIKILEKMIGLSAFFRHDSLIPALEEMLEEPEFEWHCLYDCPLTFALRTYGAFGGWEPPANITLLPHIRSEIERIGRTSFARRDPRDYSLGSDEFNKIMNRMIKLTEEELIRTAGAENPDRSERAWAAHALSATVDSSRNLKDLYWLVIDDIDDASAEYRTAVYSAVYRAEKARQAGR